MQLYESDSYIKIPDLKEGYAYSILARNAWVGIWLNREKAFLISRYKFGQNYLFKEYHWDTGEPFGTVKPQKEIAEAPFSPEFLYDERHCAPDKYPPSDEILNYLNSLTEYINE
jgi:hypothetical protein